MTVAPGTNDMAQDWASNENDNACLYVSLKGKFTPEGNSLHNSFLLIPTVYQQHWQLNKLLP